MERLSERTEQLKSEHHSTARFARYVHALGYCAGDPSKAYGLVEHLERRAPQVGALFKAAVVAGSTAPADWGSSLSSWESVAAPFIDLTDRRAIWAALKERSVRVPFNVRAIVTTSPTDAAFVRPGGALPLTALSLADTSVLKRYKLGVLTAVTNEMFEIPFGPAVQSNLSERLIVSTARGLDRALIDPDSSGVSDETPASLTSGLSPVGLLGATAAGALTSFEALLQSLVTAGSDLSRVLIAMAPSTALTLSMMRDSGGGATFPQLSATGGSINGVPVFVTASAVRSGSPPERIVAALDGARVVFADDNEVEVSASKIVNLQMDDAPSMDAGAGTGANTVSGWQTGTTAIKVVRWTNFQRADDSGVRWLTSNF